MKKLVALLCLMNLSCNNNKEAILGTWKVDSKFYRATYNIVEVDGDLKAEVVYYNDDTTVLRQNKDNPFYLFNNLKFQNEDDIDATSGATKSKNQSASLKLKHNDTLLVTTLIMNKPLKETWIKIKKQ